MQQIEIFYEGYLSDLKEQVNLWLEEKGDEIVVLQKEFSYLFNQEFPFAIVVWYEEKELLEEQFYDEISIQD